jgi:endoglucanase
MHIKSYIISLFTLFVGSSAWTVKNGHIFNEEGQQTNLRALSWFGFETQDFVVNGLWVHPLDWYLDIVKQNNINAIRIPFSAEWIYYNWDIVPNQGIIGADPEMQGKTSIQILDALFDYTEENDILIMLDLHRLHKEYISELWYSPYDDQYPSTVFFETWYKMLDRYKDRKNLFAVDLLNEPHGQATWGTDNLSNDWRLFSQGAILKLIDRYPDAKWVYFVEGIGWGKYLHEYQNRPFDLHTDVMKKVVFSPHNYGKSVVPGISMNQDNLYYDWDYNFGFLRDMGFTVVPGEWGGKTYLDSDWMTIFIDYLIKKDIRSSFFWSLGPNSGDVQGLLYDDWTSIDTFKLNIINKLQPNPSN